MATAPPPKIVILCPRTDGDKVVPPFRVKGVSSVNLIGKKVQFVCKIDNGGTTVAKPALVKIRKRAFRVLFGMETPLGGPYTLKVSVAVNGSPVEVQTRTINVVTSGGARCP